MQIRTSLFILAFLLASCAKQETDMVPTAPGAIDWMIGAAATAEEVHPLLPGMMAASFTAKRADGSDFVFDADNLEHQSILVFYRGGWCPYCNRQLMELRDIDHDLVELGYDLFFISADRPEKLSEDSMGDDLPYTLVSDSKMEVSKAFRIAYKVDDETVARYKRGGLDLAEESGYPHYLLPAPSVFIVDEEGIIQFQYTNINYRQRVSREVLMAAARVTSGASD